MRRPLRSRLHALAGTLAGYASATYLTLVLFLAGYGAVVPWPADRAALRDVAGPGTVVLAGMRSASEQTPDGLRIENDRYYMVLPDTFRHARFWRVSERDGGPPRAAPSPQAFWAVSLFFLLSLVGTWRYWIRPSDPSRGAAAAHGADAARPQ